MTMVEMYHPDLHATNITTQEAFDTVWSRDGRGWVLLADHLAELTGKVTGAPDEATDDELRAVLTAAGGGFAPMDGATRDQLQQLVAVLAQHGPTPDELQTAAQLAAGIPSTWDPAGYSVPEVQAYLDHATEDERKRVLALEKKKRPDLPDAKQQRAGVLDYTPKEQ